MFTKAVPLFFRAITPVHAGSGHDLGIVDMPIQREKSTGIPKIEGSGVKGAFKEYFRTSEKISLERVNILFGPEIGNEHASALGFTDARLLFFPVRSLKGIFALITCPYILDRLYRDLDICGYSNNELQELATLIKTGQKLREGQCCPFNDKVLGFDGKIFLEEYIFETKDKVSSCDKICDEKIRDRIVILSDEDFIDFVTLYTEVITRNRINIDTGTTDDKALFTEEYLPAESILYSLVLASDRYIEKKEDENTADKNMKDFLDNKPEIMQIGGNATVGKGIVEVICKEVI